jgi:hypothetical protein
MLVSIAAAIGMILYSRDLKDRMKAVVDQRQPEYERVRTLAAKADDIITQGRPIMVNTSLAKAMDAHNTKYPDLYDEIRRYIPSFYRIRQMAATPAGPGTSTVTLSGYLQTQQQYADLMLALMRIPGAQSVSRDGYQITAPKVPKLTEPDQTGRPLRPGEGAVPTDPLDRLNYYIAQGSTSGFENVGSFGSGDNAERGAMPGYSLVNVAIVVNRDLMVPDPRGTLGGIGALTGTPTFGPPGGAPGTAPGTPAGAPPAGGRGGRGGPGEDR